MRADSNMSARLPTTISWSASPKRPALRASISGSRQKTLVKVGGASFGAGTDDFPVLLRALIGLPIQMVTGYKGTSEMRLAFSSGEIGGISNSWQSTRSTWRREVETGELQLVFQAAFKSHPDLT